MLRQPLQQNVVFNIQPPQLQEQPIQPQINISREQETPEIIQNKLDSILEQSPNSIRKYLKKRNIDLATINLNRNPLIKGIQEEYPIEKLHSLLKNFSSFKNKKQITKTDIEIIKYEIELNKKINCILSTNQLEDLKQFLEKESINLNFFRNDNNPLIYAIKNGISFKLIDYLLQHNVNINFHLWNGSTPLTEAAITNNKKVFNLLLKKGANNITLI
ncbi:hypothetical protein BCR36DRAFT_401789 [Piromyces finnis]|uniref:Uncharacterized protein n=1 Tax=Piromyces finnis TaxID=1754191 RepID=A0A1Y1VL24_9FUNG|nr:hypothetical protein BCR36DRAFT_401789 [Piromyces finnis]|eukprot:ORX59168.1 hypothetical protein BCR36DRAFT_401789 [Piromyces finnis]